MNETETFKNDLSNFKKSAIVATLATAAVTLGTAAVENSSSSISKFPVQNIESVQINEPISFPKNNNEKPKGYTRVVIIGDTSLKVLNEDYAKNKSSYFFGFYPVGPNEIFINNYESYGIYVTDISVGVPEKESTYLNKFSNDPNISSTNVEPFSISSTNGFSQKINHPQLFSIKGNYVLGAEITSNRKPIYNWETIAKEQGLLMNINIDFNNVHNYTIRTMYTARTKK